MRDTKSKGDTCEGIVMAVLLQTGKKVLVPFGENRRYDIAIDEDGKLVRVQCKMGKLDRGVIRFNTCSSHYHRGGSLKGYRGEVEFFGVFCPQNGRVYLIPTEKVPVGHGILRVDKPRNNQRVKLLAAEYEVASIVQVAERLHGKQEVVGSTPTAGSNGQC